MQHFIIQTTVPLGLQSKWLKGDRYQPAGEGWSERLVTSIELQSYCRSPCPSLSSVIQAGEKRQPFIQCGILRLKPWSGYFLPVLPHTFIYNTAKYQITVF